MCHGLSRRTCKPRMSPHGSNLAKRVMQGGSAHVGIVPLVAFKYNVIRPWWFHFQSCRALPARHGPRRLLLRSKRRSGSILPRPFEAFRGCPSSVYRGVILCV